MKPAAVMPEVFGPAECQNLRRALAHEWLETNGLGGYASSTMIGTNTRRHHGLLVAALKPPVERHVLLAKVEEQVLVDGAEAQLGTNVYPGTIFPHGFHLQTEFRLRPWPTFRYATAAFEIEKSITLIHGHDTVVIRYRLLKARGAVELRVRPLLAYREYNALTQRNDTANLAVEESPNGLSVQLYDSLPRLELRARPRSWAALGEWYFRFTYPVEQDRGLEYEEDLVAPCELVFQLQPGQTESIVVTTELDEPRDANELLARERERRTTLDTDPDPVRRALVTAADTFLARRGRTHQTVLAGFPWFTDWGRDTMIALPGLTFTTGRSALAFEILQTFASYCDRGMIPNVFPDVGTQPEYNTVDAALWLVVTAWRYWKATADNDGARRLLPSLREVIRHYRDGTRFDIRADHDGLITAGTAGTQLTWMDVKVDGYIPTPRHGKPVEVNALWYNALTMVADLEEALVGDANTVAACRRLAQQVRQQFNETFWYASGGYLYDVVRPEDRDASLRPNQIFAISLPYAVLEERRQRTVLDVVTEHLLTPYGLRSLSPRHPRYVGAYAGNPWQRDCAYHQGTVWPWLIGPYCDAWARVHGNTPATRQRIAELLHPLLHHLGEGALGTIAELFDGDSPHRPGGCFAQAWSVAEVLRVYDTYGGGAQRVRT